jgi:hypothetical protein
MRRCRLTPTPANDAGTGIVDVRGPGGDGGGDDDGDDDHVNGTGDTASTGANSTGPMVATVLLSIAGALALAVGRRRRERRAD